MKKVGKTTRPFRYDLNQIPYGYTVKVTNRFKGFETVNSVPEELWMEVCNIVQEAANKTIPKKKKGKKAKWLSEEALQIAEKRGEAKGKGEKERYTHLNAEFQRKVRRDKKNILNGIFLLKPVLPSPVLVISSTLVYLLLKIPLQSMCC